MHPTLKLPIYILAALTTIKICQFFLSRSLISVPSGHVGVITRFGEVKGNGLEPGLNVVVPMFDNVTIVDCRMTDREDSSGGFSSDFQTLDVTTALQYSLEPTLAVGMIKSIGGRNVLESGLIKKAIEESVKAVTTNFTSTELLLNRLTVRNSMIKLIETRVNKALSKKQINGLVQIANFALVDVQFTATFNQAIENVVRAEQEALTAEKRKSITITNAEAQEAEKRILADAEAYRMIRIANATAFKIEVEANALSQQENNDDDACSCAEENYLQLKTLEKWNGQVPELWISNMNEDNLPFVPANNQN